MRVMVTGGAGFIGRHLVAALVTGGHEVTVLDNLRRGKRAAVEQIATRFVVGDIRDRAAVAAAADGTEMIYHLAAQSNVLGAVSDIDYSFTTNVIGTYNVLTAARDFGMQRVVFTSSREVYGEVEHLPVREDQALNPKNPYGASKVAGEAYCQTFANTYGLDVHVLRLANVYGAGDHDRVIPMWLQRAHRGEELDLYGGDQVLDFVPIPLVVHALRGVADRSPPGTPINIGSGVGTTLKALATRIQSLPGVHCGWRILPARSVEVTRFIADVTRMRELLGLQPPVDPLEALPALWDSPGLDPTGLR